jgi:hypothetical protein
MHNPLMPQLTLWILHTKTFQYYRCPSLLLTHTANEFLRRLRDLGRKMGPERFQFSKWGSTSRDDH